MKQAPVLAYYWPEKDTIVSADTSSYGLGAVLLQVKDDGSIKFTAYASRSLTSTEQRYSQIEKGALATTWACETFADYILGKELKIETDHNPLIPLLGSKCLQDLPPRIQRFRMRLMRCSYQIAHVPGKDLTTSTADTLSRAPLHRSLTKEETKLNEELNLHVSHVIESLPAAERRLQEVRPHQDEDEICLTCLENSTERVGRRNIKSVMRSNPTLAIQGRNNRPTRHPGESWQSHHFFAFKNSLIINEPNSLSKHR